MVGRVEISGCAGNGQRNQDGEGHYPRGAALEAFLQTFETDVFCLQELTLSSYEVVIKNLPSHNYLGFDEPQNAEDFKYQPVGPINIFYNKYLFEKLAEGSERVGESYL